jgi:hypothetical protein
LFTHLRGLAGQISPPRPVDHDTLPPMMRRRGATAGLEDPEPTEDADPTGYYNAIYDSYGQASLDDWLGPNSMAVSPVNPEPTDNSAPSDTSVSPIRMHDEAFKDWLFRSNGYGEPTDHSDFLPPPGFYSWGDLNEFDWEYAANYDPGREESADEDDDETMDDAES